jgi:hypothetical protein
MAQAAGAQSLTGSTVQAGPTQRQQQQQTGIEKGIQTGSAAGTGIGIQTRMQTRLAEQQQAAAAANLLSPAA